MKKRAPNPPIKPAKTNKITPSNGKASTKPLPREKNFLKGSCAGKESSSLRFIPSTATNSTSGNPFSPTSLRTCLTSGRVLTTEGYLKAR